MNLLSLISDLLGIAPHISKKFESPPYREPDFEKVKDVLTDEEPDLFRLLQWSTEYGPDLPGREREIEALLDWARGKPGTVSVAILAAPGGAGKTRLAAHVARRLMDENWEAGFLDPNAGKRFPEKPPGWMDPAWARHDLFLIIDYPEERLEAVEETLKRLAGWVGRRRRSVRVLLPTRDENAERFQDILHHCNLFGTLKRFSMSSEGDLSDKAARKLANQVRTALEGERGFRGKGDGRASENFDKWFGTWLDRDKRNHSLPLMVMAATIYWLLKDDEEPPETDISSSKVLKALAEREWRRLRSLSRQMGLGEMCLPRLLALATLAGGLEEAQIRALLNMPENEGPCEKGAPLDRLMESHLWGRPASGSDPCLLPLQPDRPAAAFVHEALLADKTFRKDSLPHWLDIALEGREEDFCNRLPRILWDLRQARGDTKRFTSSLETMIASHEERAPAFEAVTWISGHRTAPFAIAVIGQLLRQRSQAHSKAALLNNLAGRLSEIGDRKAALEAAREAAETYSKLAQENPAAFMPDLALSLNNLAAFLSETGDRGAALEAAREAAETYRKLAQENPAAFMPDLAMSLNNLAAFLSETGDRIAALEAAREAAETYRKLAQENPAAFMPDLAMSLNNLAAFLSETGDRIAALEAAREAVEIRRKLAQENPAAFMPGLAMSLNNLAGCLSETGDRRTALEAAREAVETYRKLAQENPAAFMQDLAATLNNLAVFLSETGDQEAALKVAQEGAETYRKLVQENPDTFMPDLARAMDTLGRVQLAGDASGEAVKSLAEGLRAIATPLARLPAAFAPLAAVLAQDYLKACERTGEEPDVELLAPVAGTPQKLQEREGRNDGA